MKSYKMNNLGCANCAAKMEHDIQKLPGVHSVTINFMTQKMKLDADESRLDEILDAAQAIVSKHESYCSIVR